MGNVTEIIDLAEKLIEKRKPLQVRSLFEGTTPPIFLVVITNISREEPVVIKEVRVHFGMPEYNYAFVLTPCNPTAIQPKHDQTFHRSYDGCVVQHTITIDHRPDSIGSGTPPRTPAHLFIAISKAKPSDSWIEVDFNEFTHRKFLQGKVQPVFEHMVVVGRKASSQSDGR